MHRRRMQCQKKSVLHASGACASMMPQHDKLLQSTGHIHSYAQDEIRAKSQRETAVQANTLSRRSQPQSVLSSMHSLWKSADLSTNFITCPSKSSGSDTRTLDSAFASSSCPPSCMFMFSPEEPFPSPRFPASSPGGLLQHPLQARLLAHMSTSGASRTSAAAARAPLWHLLRHRGKPSSSCPAPNSRRP